MQAATSLRMMPASCRVYASGDREPESSAPHAGFVKASIETVSKSPESGPVIILKMAGSDDLNGLLLPVFVGENEHNALIAEIRKQPAGRPQTHDLMRSCIEALDAKVTRVYVTHLRNNTYYARVYLASRKAGAPATEMDLDARPSDAINLAVRFAAPIYVSQEVAKTCGVRNASGGLVAGAAVTAASAAAAASVAVPRPAPKKVDGALELRVRMALAVAEGREDDAARLRDEVAALLGGSATPHAVAAASLMLEVERAVRDERYRDAAHARDHLSAMDDFLQQDEKE